ncbi:MAG TPA: response regulator [Anaerolineales bacterium]|nr:response regulator [Anaerolineales bacterium]
MTATSNQTRVILIGDPGPVQQQITAALSSQSEFLLVDVLSSLDRLVREVRAAEPDIILMDHRLGNQPTLDIVDDVALQYPQAPIVAVLPENDPVVIQQIMLAGARAFLVQPFTQVNLLSTLRRVHELESRRTHLQAAATAASAAGEATRPLRSLAIFSPRGGVGCSTLATNLAISLYEETSARVLLMEGKLFFGHVDVLLNIRTRNTIADLLPHASNLDESLVRDVVVRHATGIEVLLGPRDLQVAQGIRPDDMYAVFISLQRLYDHIVIDVGNNLNENTVTLMDASDRVMLVTTPDLAALHDASQFVQISRSLGYPAEKLLVALNRAGYSGGIRTGDIESALRHELYAQVPDDSPNAIRSLNRGIPLIIRYPRSPVSRALKSLAKSLLEVHMAEPLRAAVSTAEKSRREALLASSRLG